MMTTGCTGCGMEYSFFFSLQFHKAECTALSDLARERLSVLARVESQDEDVTIDVIRKTNVLVERGTSREGEGSEVY